MPNSPYDFDRSRRAPVDRLAQREAAEGARAAGNKKRVVWSGGTYDYGDLESRLDEEKRQAGLLYGGIRSGELSSTSGRMRMDMGNVARGMAAARSPVGIRRAMHAGSEAMGGQMAKGGQIRSAELHGAQAIQAAQMERENAMRLRHQQMLNDIRKSQAMSEMAEKARRQDAEAAAAQQANMMIGLGAQGAAGLGSAIGSAYNNAGQIPNYRTSQYNPQAGMGPDYTGLAKDDMYRY